MDNLIFGTGEYFHVYVKGDNFLSIFPCLMQMKIVNKEVLIFFLL